MQVYTSGCMAGNFALDFLLKKTNFKIAVTAHAYVVMYSEPFLIYHPNMVKM